MNLPKVFLIIVSIIIAVLAFFMLQKYREDENNLKIYFVKTSKMSKKTVIFPVSRTICKGNCNVKNAVEELLKGPTSNEKKVGLFTEIPSKTILIDIKENKKSIIVNLTKDFESEGGSESMVIRLKQLSYTVDDLKNKKPVYLEVEGQKVEYLGGEGIEVKQPLSENVTRH